MAINRRTFLKRASAAAAMGAPLVASSRAIAASDRLVVAVGQWGIETPFAWRSSQSEKTLWDCAYDPLIMRDPKTFEYRPGLATEWKPSNELKTWTFMVSSSAQIRTPCFADDLFGTVGLGRIDSSRFCPILQARSIT